MSIQGYLQKREINNPSYIEKAADALLLFPRVMWLNREITVDTSANNLNETGIYKKSLLNGFRSIWIEKYPDLPSPPNGDELKGTFIVTMFLSIVFFAGSIVALPLLGLGASLKKISYLKDKRANAYHQLIETRIEEVALKKKKQHLEEVHQKLEKNKLDIEEDLQTIGPVPEVNPYVKNMLNNKITPLENIKKIIIEKDKKVSSKINLLNNKIEPINQKLETAFANFKKEYVEN